jgi:hypothetical protein
MNELDANYFWISSVVVWAIFITAFIAYALLIELCFMREAARTGRIAAESDL